MASIQKWIDVEVPVRTAYNQWTQFEEFPSFMEGVTAVTQLDDRRLQWKANIGGKDKEWNAEITEQHPDERVAWTSTSGARNAGVVTFHRLADDKHRQAAEGVHQRRDGGTHRPCLTATTSLAWAAPSPRAPPSRPAG